LAEKRIVLPTIQVDLRAGEQFRPEFRAINPACTVPVLEFDDGQRIAEVVAICVYLEADHPDPPLMGIGAQDRAIVAAWQSRMEREGLWAVAEAFRNSTPGLKGRALPGPDNYEQIPALAERGRARVARFFKAIDRELEDHEFIAGDRFSIADITALVTVDFAGWIKLPIPDECTHLDRWHRAMVGRPSAAA
jgi:glutathione S-transferase